ncbi:MAG TPA: 3D domain-containing protein [Gaiellaceae bacterium]|nr:3D domain-containing protein [Gaiellaceae bacterium]
MARRNRSRTARLAGLALALGLVAASSALASQTADPAAPAASRGTRAHQALLELYALDSRLQASQARAAYLAAEAAKLRRERRALHSELRAARATLATSQRQLAFQLRTLYEQGQVDPLAVVFGSTSLRSGLRALDDLKLSAAESTRVVAMTRAAERRLFRARRTLTGDAKRLARSIASARATEQSLASTAASKSSYVASLRAGAGAAETAGLLSSAQSAAEKSRKVGHGHTPPQPPPKGGRKMTVSATCYILKGTTASGLPVGPGIVAVDPTVIPLGTRLYIPGYGKGIAADIGGGIKGKIIDLWYSTYAQCAKWGRRTVTITVY